MEVIVGDRVSIKGELATIKWIGELDGRQGQWIGVEWDSASRGKHSGELDGRSYFTTRRAGAGSFLKAQNFAAEEAVCLSLAILDKYADKTEQDTSELYVSTVRHMRKAIELIGTEKIQAKQERLELLTEIALQTSRVKEIDPGFGARLISCQDMLLDQNLINSWGQVNAILSEVPHLRTLSLSKNRILFGSLEGEFTLQTLVLNSMDLSWEEVLPITQHFPGLQELHLYSNNCSELSVPEGYLAKLKFLNLQDNAIRSWDMVSANLSPLPSLEKLILNQNLIEFVNYQGGFPSLTALSMEKNALNDWRSIEELHNFPAGIQELRVGNNEMLQQGMQTSMFRYMVIARVGKLKLLNGSTVRAQERIDAERYFLRSNLNNEAAHQLSRWQELIQEHGNPEDIASRVVSDRENLASQTLNSNAVSVIIRALTAKAVGKEVKKNLPLNMNIGALKALCAKLFACDTGLIKLTYRESKEVIMPESMDDNLKELSYYMLKDGGEIWVEDS